MTPPCLKLVAVRDAFRSNARWPSCHCATVSALGDGRLGAAWYAGSYETAPDQAILYSRFDCQALIWDPPTVLVDTPGKADGNPVLWRAKSGTTWLFYVTIVGHWWHECKVFAAASPDGVRWDAPSAIREEWGWMTRARPLELDGGPVLLPLYDERDWSAHVATWRDGRLGARWGHLTTSQGVIQPSLVPLGDGRVGMYLRTGGRGGSIWYSQSEDGGRTWAYPEPTPLPNPNSGIDALRLHDGRLVLAYNESRSRRTPLALAVSRDEGRTWQREAIVASGPGEFSYPVLLEGPDERLHLLYTHRRRAIRHCIYETRSR
ncbi:MAG: exo-alpha-sialidase [Anaerolineae bacterium]|nr:exo-alpha-sialidase [Anaerolineae bacterium]